MVKQVSVQQLIAILKQAWSAETSYLPEEWSEGNPARGQCVVSALVINDTFGGDFRRYEAQFGDTKEKHYVNVLPDGIVVDAARSQYPVRVTMIDAPVDLSGFRSIREKLLDDEDTLRRYVLLRQKVDDLLRA